MNSRGIGLVLLLAGAVALGIGLSLPAEEDRDKKKKKAADEDGRALVHNVYFSLKDSSADSRKKFIAACKKYLTKHKGEVYFAVGPIVDELKREVNDRDFDVALTIVFKNKATHDEYQDAKRHLQFIEENKDSW